MNLSKYVYIFLIDSMVSIFVKEVKYPELSSKNVNSDYCGYTVVPIISKINFTKTCFFNFYDNLTFIDSIKRLESESIESRIFNGEVVNPSEAPWAVALHKMYHEFHSSVLYEVAENLCGGSLITFQWVITAAHCLPDNRSHWIRVSSGLILGNAWNGRQRRFARQDNFFMHNSVDLALVKLPEPFTRVIRDGQFIINTICLPQKTEFTNEEDEIAVMFGLGETAREGGSWSSDLVKGTFRIPSYTACQNLSNLYPTIYEEWNKTLCANTTRTGVSKTCAGDSGSGLVQYTNQYESRAILFGVHNGLIGRNDSGACGEHDRYPLRYPYLAAVSVHIDWILDTIRNN